jgi:hypothetical protein
MTKSTPQSPVPKSTDGPKSNCQLSILIPFVSDGLNLKMLLKLSSALLHFPCEILIIAENDSANHSPEQLNNDKISLRTVCTPETGLTNAIKAGFEAARAERVLIFAADEVGPILAIDDMFDLMNEGCDIVSCTRYKYGGRRLGSSLLAHGLSRLANWSFSLLAGSAFSDVTTGVKMLRRDLLKEIDLTAKSVGWAVAFEISIKTQMMGFKLGEVPTISVDRLYGGTSRFNVLTWSIEYLRWFFWGCWTLRRSKDKTPNHELLVKKSSLSISIR